MIGGILVHTHCTLRAKASWRLSENGCVCTLLQPRPIEYAVRVLVAPRLERWTLTIPHSGAVSLRESSFILRILPSADRGCCGVADAHGTTTHLA